MEEILIKRIEAAIRAIRMGTKEPKDVNPAAHFEKLKLLNEGMHQDLMQKYKNVMTDYNNKKQK
jgi:hypothetical protein